MERSVIQKLKPIPEVLSKIDSMVYHLGNSSVSKSYEVSSKPVQISIKEFISEVADDVVDSDSINNSEDFESLSDVVEIKLLLKQTRKDLLDNIEKIKKLDKLSIEMTSNIQKLERNNIRLNNEFKEQCM